jgi:hypothetical protein
MGFSHIPHQTRWYYPISAAQITLLEHPQNNGWLLGILIREYDNPKLILESIIPYVQSSTNHSLSVMSTYIPIFLWLKSLLNDV